eukprot:CAMPEP_0194496386 /NCGR_PEP_ID=MMETSP0253-20130528/13678_1 /TAXON_ID=2966 /ORGANISM="Noctiluca scintillans" /LENGTH=125 /DNA_ID=CAMNT_0039337775 /DNA_START=126 /DNA_END=503 /DNA_ORIENTATION=+
MAPDPTSFMALRLPRDLRSSLDQWHTAADELRDTELWFQAHRMVRRHAFSEFFGAGVVVGGAVLLASKSRGDAECRAASALSARRTPVKRRLRLQHREWEALNPTCSGDELPLRGFGDPGSEVVA